MNVRLFLSALGCILTTPASGDEFCEGLWRARNAVFARNGYCFESPKAQAVFGKGCFAPYGKLTPADEAIVATIKSLERDGNCLVSGTADEAASAQIPSYTVAVTLSPKAREKLDSSGETVRVAAYYYGEAKPGVPADEVGEISLGSETKDIEQGSSVTLGGRIAPAEELSKIVGGKPKLLINVYSSRKVFEDNLLDCGIWQDDATKASTLTISCKLIGE